MSRLWMDYAKPSLAGFIRLCNYWLPRKPRNVYPARAQCSGCLCSDSKWGLARKFLKRRLIGFTNINDMAQRFEFTVACWNTRCGRYSHLTTGVFGVNICKKCGKSTVKFLSQTCLSLNGCSSHNFWATECSKSLDWTLVDAWLNDDFHFSLKIKISRIFLT